jgi:hypothetical protein
VGAFYSPQGNLPLGVRNPDMSKSRSDMSYNHLWNLAKKPNKAGVTQDKADRPNMFGLGSEHVRVRSLEPG